MAVLASLAAVAAIGYSAARTKQSAPSTLRFEEAKTLRFGNPDRCIYAPAIPLTDESLAGHPMKLPSRSELTFSALAISPAYQPCAIEIFLLMDGQAHSLKRIEPVLVREKSALPEDLSLFTGHDVRVSLEQYAGRTVSFTWAASGSIEGTTAYLINPAIRPILPKEQRLPDILMVCSDTHRYDYALGSRNLDLMPNLAELAREGVAYHSAFSCASWTLPSITSFFTGLFPRFHRCGYRVLGQDVEPEPLGEVPPGVFRFNLDGGYRQFTAHSSSLITLGDRLQQQGYITAMAVSNGFYTLSGLAQDGQDLVYYEKVEGARLNESALKLLAALPKDRPRFLFVHYMDVHQYLLWYFRKKYPDVELKDYLDQMRASYADAARITDRNLGDLLNAWKGAVSYENSLVVFWSDHGEHLYDPGRDLVDHGNTMDEVLLHVPLVIKYPSGTTLDFDPSYSLVNLVDVYPTVLDLLHLDPDQSLSGLSLLQKPSATTLPGRTLYADYQLYGEEQSVVRLDQNKLVLNPLEQRILYLQDTSLPPSRLGEYGQRIRNATMEEDLNHLFKQYVKSAEEKTEGLTSDVVVNERESMEQLKAIGYVK